MSEKIDLRDERSKMIWGLITSVLAAIPYVGTVFGIISIVLYYMGFDGYAKKLGLDGARKYYLRGIIWGIVLFAVGAGLIIGGIVVTGGSVANHVDHGGAFNVINSEYGYDSNTLSDEAIALIAAGGLILFVAILLMVYYFAKALVVLGDFFGIEEFRKYKTMVYIAYFLLPVWVVTLFGLVVFAILAVIAFVYLVLGISKLPDSWDAPDGFSLEQKPVFS